MSITLLHLVLLVFASFRLTRLITVDRITKKLRDPFLEEIEEEMPDGSSELFLRIKGSGFKYWMGELLSCYWCTGIWSTLFLLVGYWFLPLYFMPLIILLAIAGAAAIIEAVIQRIG